MYAPEDFQYLRVKYVILRSDNVMDSSVDSLLDLSDPFSVKRQDANKRTGESEAQTTSETTTQGEDLKHRRGMCNIFVQRTWALSTRQSILFWN